jgi:hypothetical protein
MLENPNAASREAEHQQDDHHQSEQSAVAVALMFV